MRPNTDRLVVLFVLLGGGHVWVWGTGSCGQLGLGSTSRVRCRQLKGKGVLRLVDCFTLQLSLPFLPNWLAFSS